MNTNDKLSSEAKKKQQKQDTPTKVSVLNHNIGHQDLIAEHASLLFLQSWSPT